MKEEIVPNIISTKKEKIILVVTYGLYAISAFTVITFFVAVIVNYVKRKSVKDTWLESHHSWLIRTFWWSGLMGILGFVFIVGIGGASVATGSVGAAFAGKGIGYLITGFGAIWYIYRIIKGFLRLMDNKATYRKKNKGI